MPRRGRHANTRRVGEVEFEERFQLLNRSLGQFVDSVDDHKVGFFDLLSKNIFGLR